MIISLNILNSTHVQQTYHRYPKTLYGLALPYAVDCAYSGILAQAESLFICGHGSPGSIGHPDGAPRFTPEELARWLGTAVLPFNYCGSIYIAAPGADSSYIDALLIHMGKDFDQRIHGQFNQAYNQIMPPSPQNWVEAAA